MFRWLCGLSERTPVEARALIRDGKAPDRLRVRGRLDLSNSAGVTYLPRQLEVESLDLSDCTQLRGLPEQLRCDELILRRTRIKRLPSGIHVPRIVDAQDCRELETIFPLRVLQLNLRGCSSLQCLPNGLEARRLAIGSCPRLTAVPPSVAATVEQLDASECISLAELPDNFERLQSLNVRGCSNLLSLPDGIRIRSSIDVADSGLRSLPWSLRSVRILWRGVTVSERVAFQPETITVGEILAELNLTVRRILLDRVGMERFIDQAEATVVNHDHDAGGERRLLRIIFAGGEDVVCMEVRCPSTGSRYVLRVPPRMATCVEAAAWIAGYSDPSRYRPAVET